MPSTGVLYKVTGTRVKDVLTVRKVDDPSKLSVEERKKTLILNTEDTSVLEKKGFFRTVGSGAKRHIEGLRDAEEKSGLGFGGDIRRLNAFRKARAARKKTEPKLRRKSKSVVGARIGLTKRNVRASFRGKLDTKTRRAVQGEPMKVQNFVIRIVSRGGKLKSALITGRQLHENGLLTQKGTRKKQ